MNRIGCAAGSYVLSSDSKGAPLVKRAHESDQAERISVPETVFTESAQYEDGVTVTVGTFERRTVETKEASLFLDLNATYAPAVFTGTLP